MKVGDKWLPALKGLLPDHTSYSYRLYCEMIKLEMENKMLNHKCKSIIAVYMVKELNYAEHSLGQNWHRPDWESFNEDKVCHYPRENRENESIVYRRIVSW